MAFTTMADVLAALSGQRVQFHKQPNAGAGSWTAAWAAAGFPASGATPSSGLAGDIPTSATTGAIPFANPGAGDLFTGRAQANIGQLSSAGMIILYDRLWHNSGVSSTAITAQTVNSVALTRPDANGAQVEAWWQVYGTMGAGTPTVTLTYTDQDGNTAQAGSSGVLATTMAAGRTGMFSLAAGDTGVRSIQTWQADATFTSGTIGLVLRRRLLAIPITRVLTDRANDVLASLIAIPDNACLELVCWTSGAGTVSLQGELLLIEG